MRLWRMENCIWGTVWATPAREGKHQGWMLQACSVALLQSPVLTFTAEGLSFRHCYTKLSYTSSFIHVFWVNYCKRTFPVLFGGHSIPKKINLKCLFRQTLLPPSLLMSWSSEHCVPAHSEAVCMHFPSKETNLTNPMLLGTRLRRSDQRVWEAPQTRLQRMKQPGKTLSSSLLLIFLSYLAEETRPSCYFRSWNLLVSPELLAGCSATHKKQKGAKSSSDVEVPMDINKRSTFQLG